MSTIYVLVHHSSVAMPRPHWPAMASHGSMHREPRPRQLSALQSPALAAPSQGVCRRQGRKVGGRWKFLIGTLCLAGSWGMNWSSPVLSMLAKSQLTLQMPSWPCQDVKTCLYFVLNSDSAFSGESHGPCYSMRACLLGFWNHSLKIGWEVQRGQTSWQGLQDECSSSIPAHVSSFGGHPRLRRWWEWVGWIMMDHSVKMCWS